MSYVISEAIILKISFHKGLAFFTQAPLPLILPHIRLFHSFIKFKKPFYHFLPIKNQYFSSKLLTTDILSAVRQLEMMTNTANYFFEKIIRKIKSGHETQEGEVHRPQSTFQKYWNIFIFLVNHHSNWILDGWKCNSPSTHTTKSCNLLVKHST